MIKLLEWDTSFFGYKVGESKQIPDNLEAKKYKYHLIYIKTLNPLDAELFSDCKITFVKDIQKQMFPDDVKSIKGKGLTDNLFNLALLSGTSSRFCLDSKFNNNEFQRLYKEWILKSLSGEIADEVFAIGEMGFVTVNLKEGNAHIGLIAVSQNSQGQGIGKKLLMAAESFAVSKGAKQLFVPTQIINKQACSFYTSYGFKEYSREYIYHYWVN